MNAVTALWAASLYETLARSFPGFQFDLDDVTAWVEWVADLDEGSATRAAQALSMRPPHWFPSGPAVRRRALEDAGLFAPPFSEAQRLLAEVRARRLAWEELPGPVQSMDAHALNAGRHEIDARAEYEAIAEAHDRVVEQPGGLGVLREAGVWLAAVRERSRRLQLAFVAADALGELTPPSSASDERVADVLTRYRQRFGGVPELPAVVDDPDVLWGDPPPVLADALSRVRALRSVDGAA